MPRTYSSNDDVVWSWATAGNWSAGGNKTNTLWFNKRFLFSFDVSHPIAFRSDDGTLYILEDRLHPSITKHIKLVLNYITENGLSAVRCQHMLGTTQQSLLGFLKNRGGPGWHPLFTREPR